MEFLNGDVRELFFLSKVPLVCVSIVKASSHFKEIADGALITELTIQAVLINHS